jgi:hypothetical protein
MMLSTSARPASHVQKVGCAEGVGRRQWTVAVLVLRLDGPPLFWFGRTGRNVGNRRTEHFAYQRGLDGRCNVCWAG